MVYCVLLVVFCACFGDFCGWVEWRERASQADVAERYTRLSQKQVPKGLRVRVPPSAPLVFGVHRCLPPPPQANRMSTLIYGNPLLSTGFAVSSETPIALHYWNRTFRQF